METQMQKGILVVNSIILVIILTYSCTNNRESKEIELLNTYIEDNKESFVFNNEMSINYDNSNELIISRVEKYIKNKPKKSDSIINVIFSEKEYDNYKKQTVNSKWEESLSKNLDIKLSNKMTVKQVSKPIYTIDRKYALVYYLSKGPKGIYFLPKIDIYFHEKEWKKLYEIPPKLF